jgi:hypothetical protein
MTQPAPELIKHRASPQRVASFRRDVDVNSPNELPQYGACFGHCTAHAQQDLERRHALTR